MKKKTLIIIVVAVVVVVLAAVIVIPKVTGKRSGNNGSTNEQENITQGNSAGGTTNNQDASNSNGGSASSNGSSSGQSSNSTTPDGQGANTQPSDNASNAIPTISFPYEIVGSGLVVEQVRTYSGYFLEDGSDREVSNVAVIVLTNNGGDLEFAGIGISQGSRNLAFSASQIPAGATIIIQEQNGAAFDMDDPYYSATATTTPTEGFEMSREYVSVKDNGDNTFTVRNITDQTLSKVQVFFKNYLPDEGVYVGGITYSITLQDVEDGTEVDVRSDHYDSQYSTILEVVAEW